MILPSIPAQVLPTLDVLCARVSIRLLRDAELPAFKGAMLRGGFGYAFQRAVCAPPCWQDSANCPVRNQCAYQRIFEPHHPAQTAQLHNLRDIPRPFVIEPPLPARTIYRAGDSLEFGLVLIGSVMHDLTYFINGFSQLGRLGLGRQQTPAQLERIEVLQPWQPVGVVVYQDGQALPSPSSLPIYNPEMIAHRAVAMPPDMHMRLLTPLRIKADRQFLRTFDLLGVIRALGWRLRVLATFYGGSAENYDYRPFIELARSVKVDQIATRWVDWERRSTRDTQPRPMNLGGIIGSVVLRNVPVELRALLLAGTLTHVGKACVFGHGQIELEAL